jgi:PAS domain-containing protein
MKAEPTPKARKKKAGERAALISSVFEALAEPLLVVDAGMRIVLANRAAQELTGLPGQAVELRLGPGEALGCLNSAAGCGRGPACTGCAFRLAVQQALDSGQVQRARVRLVRRIALEGRSADRPANLLVSAFPVAHREERLCLLVLADIQTLFDIRGLLPICAGCKKIRNELGRWESVELHLGERLNLDFSHSICPDCAKRLYGRYDLEE